jgi:hypothetical protein
MTETKKQFETAISLCREIFEKKLADYGASWRMMRPESITDQILIKARRIRCLEIKKTSRVGEGIIPEFAGIVNYGIIGLIQLERGFSDGVDMTAGEAVGLYDRHITATKELMYAKNHDYDEAWRLMRVSSYTDLILTKLHRVKEIENHAGRVAVSEGIDANYKDIVNYALFGLIKLADGGEQADKSKTI